MKVICDYCEVSNDHEKDVCDYCGAPLKVIVFNHNQNSKGQSFSTPSGTIITRTQFIQLMMNRK